MSFFQKSKWLILGVLSGCVAALAVVLLVKYAYDDPHPFSSRREVYDRMSVSYFHKIRQYGKLDAGLILRSAGIHRAYVYIGLLVMVYAIAAIYAILTTADTTQSDLEH